MSSNFKNRIARKKKPISIIQRKNGARTSQKNDNFESFLSDVGNQGIQQLFGGDMILTKMNVSQPGDFYEKQADQIASRIVNGMGKVPDIAIKINTIQAKDSSGGTIDGNTETQIKSIKGRGVPLSKSIRSFFEPHFGIDLGNVRVHNDNNSNKLANSLNARAFTYGSDIVFKDGEYQPGTKAGKELLAHELAHVVQQNGTQEKSVSRNKNPVQSANPTFELVSSAGPIVAVGRQVILTAVQVKQKDIATGDKYHLKWSAENDPITRGKYQPEVAQQTKRPGWFQWLDDTFGNEMDAALIAEYPGLHTIKADVYLADQYIETITYRQFVVEGDPKILTMCYEAKLHEVLKRCNFYDALLSEVGDVATLIATFAVVSGILIALAATGYGLAAEIIAGILAALMLGISIPKVMHGIYKLAEALELTKIAASDAAFNDAAGIMEAAVAEIGVNTLWAILAYMGLRNVKGRIEIRLSKGVKISPKVLQEYIPEKQVLPPNRRHFFKNIIQGKAKPHSENNTVIHPRVTESVKNDISLINQNKALKLDNNQILINNRIYGVEHTGRVYPIKSYTPNEFITLNRAQYNALGILNKFNGSAQAIKIIKMRPDVTPSDLETALWVWRLCQ